MLLDRRAEELLGLGVTGIASTSLIVLAAHV
jgi:hypothetical protein